MSEAYIRTEDIDPQEIKDFFVETDNDREIINLLKGRQPTLLVGSRGTGKTMLLRVAEQELSEQYTKQKNLPVFVNLVTCNIHDNNNILQVLISRTLIALQYALRRHGIVLSGSIFRPITDINANPIAAKLERFINETNLAASVNSEGINIDNELVRSDVAHLLSFLTELCDEFKIKHITFFFDEACQVFQPTQQRVFFDYFRALRTHQIVCKAAVYPGIVTYGTFQKFHDATIKRIERSIVSADYINKMREIIERHYTDDCENFKQHGELLDSIIYASSGNPRFLLKSINEIITNGNRFNTQSVNNIIRDFYGTTIWSEHIKLGEMYSGHKNMIDWARNFVEDYVLRDITKINSDENSKSTLYFSISRNAPEVVKQAIKTLEYSGIISLHTEGTKYRNEMYDRYEINLGIVVLSEKQVIIQKRIKEIVSNLSVKIFPDYGANSAAYNDYSKLTSVTDFEANTNEIILQITKKDISILEISQFLQTQLKDYGLTTIGQVLDSNEAELQNIRYIGPKRSRKISNEVYNSILEYISG